VALLQFMPWCKINQEYDLEDVIVLPWYRDEDIAALEREQNEWVNHILSSYKDIENNSIHQAALIKYEDRHLFEDLDEIQIEATKEALELLCVCALAGRDIFAPTENYCNSDCFTFYGQQIRGAPDHIGLTYRNRCGRSIDGRDINDISFICPVHVNNIGSITIGDQLLSALLSKRKNCMAAGWGVWQSAVSCFNAANTDSDAMRFQVEWILMCGAFEHLLGAKTNAIDIAQKFESKMALQDQIEYNNSNRVRGGYASEKPLRYEWMKEFYRIRGDFAHGKTATRQDMAWSFLEHVVIAAHAFPLLMKIMLAEDSLYELSLEDQIKIEAFEPLINVPFLYDPPDKKNVMDTWWLRLKSDAKEKIVTRLMTERLRAMRSQNDG